MKVLVAMSGGVDSSVAAAELKAAGHEVVGVTMRLWGGESDTGCCSVSDVDDARRVAQQLNIDHLVFNFSDDFDKHVVAPYVQAHVDGITPNPCIECNRHLKFDRLSERARLLGFDAVATGHHARIERDDEMNDVPPGEIGEIVTRSETIMSGYLDQPELTARSIVGGWFRAGDMARQDADGYLYLATRKSDMIIRGGENVYPVEIESTIADHPSVLEVAVIGIPEEHWGEIVGAAIVLRSGCKATKQEIQDLCRSRLASYKVPEHVQFFDDLPKNSTNKLVKSQIVELVINNLKG